MGLLDNFRVIEVTKAAEPSYVIIEDNKMRFTKSCAVELGFPPFIRVLLDDQGQRMAIQVAKGNESNVIKFSADKENQTKAILFQNAVMVDLIRGIMPDWEKGKKYRAKGVFSKDDKAIVFDLKTAEPYERRKKADA